MKKIKYNDIMLKIIGIICITIISIVYFIVVRQDGTVLLSLCSIIAGLIGYEIGKRKRNYK